jgi:integrase/recombinase XerD
VVVGTPTWYLHRLYYEILAWPPNPPDHHSPLLSCWKAGSRYSRPRTRQTTFGNYTASLERYIPWCEDRGENPRVDRRLVTEWVAELLASGLEPATAKARQLAVRRFSAWMDAEDTIDYADQLLGIKPPKLSEKLIRLMAETGMRAGEVLALEMSDVTMSAGIVSIRKTKSGRGRLVSFSAKAAVALDSLAALVVQTV